MDNDLNNQAPANDSAAQPDTESVSNDGNDTLPSEEPTNPQETDPDEIPQSNNETTAEQPITAPTSAPSEPVASEAQNQSFIKNLLAKAGEKIQFNKRKKLDKILELARQKGNIANADVEKLLRVSHPTASRYLRQLVEENKLKVTGKSVDSKYSPI